jgi:hypothetical protein
MKIASVTLTSNKETLISDALRSVVGWVDLACIVDLGITDGTLDVAREIMGDRIRVITASDTLTTGQLRNIGNDFALECGADWAVTLDTDERIFVDKRLDIRKALTNTKYDCLVTHALDKTYTKERFFRLPAVTRWAGHCHERADGGMFGYLPGVPFSEIPKSPEAMVAKLAFIVDEATRILADRPEDSRYWFHLGDALQLQGKHEEAVDAFRSCHRFSQDPSESAWACFCIAKSLDKLGKLWEAVDACAVGLASHPGMAELAWYAGYLNLKLGKPEPAIMWSRMAVANGLADGYGKKVLRLFYQFPPGLYEAPYETIALAEEALGNKHAAETAARLAARARKMREAA